MGTLSNLQNVVSSLHEKICSHSNLGMSLRTFAFCISKKKHGVKKLRWNLLDMESTFFSFYLWHFSVQQKDTKSWTCRTAKSQLTLGKLSLGVYFVSQLGTIFSNPTKKLIIGNFLRFGKTFAIVEVKQFTAESFYAFFQSALAMCSATLFWKHFYTWRVFVFNSKEQAFECH